MAGVNAIFFVGVIGSKSELKAGVAMHSGQSTMPLSNVRTSVTRNYISEASYWGHFYLWPNAIPVCMNGLKHSDFWPCSQVQSESATHCGVLVTCITTRNRDSRVANPVSNRPS